MIEDYPTALVHCVRAAWATVYPPIAAVRAPELAPTPCRIAHQTDDFRLRAYSGGDGEPILVVSSLINRWYVLDFRAGHSYVAMLRTLGRPVYVLEWLPPRPNDDRSFGDFVAGPLRAAVDWLGGRVSLVGYSMGGTLAACFAARYPERVERLATVCAPVRFGDGGTFARWLAPDLVNVDLMCAAWDRVPACFVHLPFWCLHPTIKLHKLSQLWRGTDMDHFMAAEVWNHDNVDLARGVFRTWVGELYQRDALVRGELVVGGARIDPRAIACPTLAISASGDDIAPPASAEALVELCGATRLRLDTGHVGVMTSRRALAAQAAALATWLGESR